MNENYDYEVFLAIISKKKLANDIRLSPLVISQISQIFSF